MPVYAGGKKMPVGYFSCYVALALSLDLLNITTREGRLFHYVLVPPNSIIVTVSYPQQQVISRPCC